jgi:hypothetical protein
MSRRFARFIAFSLHDRLVRDGYNPARLNHTALPFPVILRAPCRTCPVPNATSRRDAIVQPAIRLNREYLLVWCSDRRVPEQRL